LTRLIHENEACEVNFSLKTLIYYKSDLQRGMAAFPAIFIPECAEKCAFSIIVIDISVEICFFFAFFILDKQTTGDVFFL